MKDFVANTTQNKRLPMLDSAGNNIHFLDEWPNPPKFEPGDEDPMIMGEVKKWRLQILLAVNPWGIPSLAFADSYKKMFGKKLDVRELGFEHLSEMVSKMPEIFAVQEPDETTGMLFPDYKNDRILHDARLGRDFARPNFDSELMACLSMNASDPSKQVNPKPSTLSYPNGPRISKTHTELNYDELIHRAWLNRDEEFPEDVVLAGESYEEFLFISSAKICGTRGLYQASLLSAATPDLFYIQMKTNERDMLRLQQLPSDLTKYFENIDCSIDAYSVPREFLYPGFPCLVYAGKGGRCAWERCIVLARSKSSTGKVLIETIDYGGFYAVDPIFLYLMPRKFLDIPRQTFQVRLTNLKPPPAADEKSPACWSSKVGSRLRCFSYSNYWLDVVLMDPRPASCLQLSKSDDSSDSSFTTEQVNEDSEVNSNNNKSNLDKSKKMLRRFRDLPKFDAIIVDRNDDEMDIYLDEVLVLETYAIQDESRKDEIDTIKRNLDNVFKSLPRPTNPFYADARN